MSISVIVIVKNEEAVIARCLASVTWADEIVVLDSGSTDRTCEICREFTEKVHLTSDWPGFGPQKNRALALASKQWVFSIDADEWVSDKLRAEIQRVVTEPGDAVAFDLPRLSSFCGRYIRHSGWWPDRIVRLFKRTQASFSDSLVHEVVQVQGSIGHLQEPLMHESFVSFEDVLEKMDRYSTAGARMLRDRGRRGGLGSAVLHGLWSFLRTYVLRAGFLDGRQGFMLAVSNAEGTYYRYVKLWLMNQKVR